MHSKDLKFEFLHQECDNALKVLLECFSLVESTVSAPEIVYMMFKGLKLVC